MTHQEISDRIRSELERGISADRFRVDPGKKYKTEPHLGIETWIKGNEKIPHIIFGNFVPTYYPKKDFILARDISTYKTRQLYYHTLFHEFVHSTGHASRLNRIPSKVDTNFRVAEETTAELGALFLMEHFKILTEPRLVNSCWYVKGYFKEWTPDPHRWSGIISNAESAYSFLVENTLDRSA